jgi:hypothetical protein
VRRFPREPIERRVKPLLRFFSQLFVHNKVCDYILAKEIEIETAQCFRSLLVIIQDQDKRGMDHGSAMEGLLYYQAIALTELHFKARDECVDHNFLTSCKYSTRHA